MSRAKNTMDQCPSSKDKARPAPKPAAARGASAASGKAYWRSLDDLAERPEFKEFVHREFPSFAGELLDGSRRHFLKLMGASLALAGAATVPGCRRPDNPIIAYNKQPEQIIPGKPLFYATAMALPGGGCEGLLAESFEGRPTKLEGNPLHPASLGKSTIWSQASVLDLYDPDRDPDVIAAMAKASGAAFGVTAWEEFTKFAAAHFEAFNATGGQGLAFLVEKATSPARDALRDRALQRWPKAKWYAYEPVDNEGAIEGSRVAFGQPMREAADLSKAKVVVSLDRDFLGGEGATLGEARGFAAGRYRPGTAPGRTAADSEMSRLYCVESMMTLTGGQADHRFAVKPSRVAAVAMLLGEGVLRRLGPGPWEGLRSALKSVAVEIGGDDLPAPEKIDAMADDLAAEGNRGASVVLAGPAQPPAVHALAYAINHALGNVGKTVRYLPLRGDAAASSLAGIRALSQAMAQGGVDTLVVIECNPVYDAPADLAFAENYAKVRHTIHLGQADETGQASRMHLARCHYLESWSDVESWDGGYSVVQPQIAPLLPSRNELELLATILGDADTDPYTIVRSALRARAAAERPASGGAAATPFEVRWRRTLHDGLWPGVPTVNSVAPGNWVGVSKLAQAAVANCGKSDALEALFLPSPHVFDGRYANNGWLQELPHPVTKVSWDNPLLVSPATAKTLGLNTNRHSLTEQYSHGQFVTLSAGSRTLDIPMWTQPGLAEGVVVLHLGYGRTVCGRVGAGTGFNTYAFRSSGSMRVAKGVSVKPTPGKEPHLLACTQDHWTMEGRDILREVDLPAWRKYGDEDLSKARDVQMDPYDRSRDINFAGRLGMEAHAPANKDIYLGSQKRDLGLVFTQLDEKGDPKRDARGNVLPVLNKYDRPIQQWGMSIDLTTCSGCGACTIACQAENNIPIVGKKEVAKGREMHWIRVDRYYASEPDTLGIGGDDSIPADPDMMVQPVTCMHCENAPCEVVCPVNATTHDPEGTNDMAYNRCIGTRYCSNNCPYKVRRFNFFDYATKQFHGSYAGQELAQQLPEALRPPSEYFVPPRLRQLKLEMATMQSNPHVTVRSRGIMEKCTYCIQRVNFARVETKLEKLDRIPDGYMETACQQACPTGSIVFGDIYDHDANEGKGSRVKQRRTDGRSYALLAFLNTRPRTTHMVRLRNPNPRLRPPNEEPFPHHGSHPGSQPAVQKHAVGRTLRLPVLSTGAMA